MYCNYCGKPIPENAIWCASCGRQVAAVAPRKRLVRPRHRRKIAGVCAAFADYFDLDVTLVRVLWLVVALFGGGGFIAYIIAWIVLPEEPMLLPAPAPTPQAQMQNQ